MAKVRFDNSNQVFFASLKSSVDLYFSSRRLKKTGNLRLYLKTVILIPLAIGIYLTLLFVKTPVIASLLLCVLLGVVLSSIGFNVMHDACHGSYSSKKWVNNLLGLTINALGGNAFFWRQKHNILHHTYTNITGMDDDIAQSKLLRQSPAQKWMRVHRYQHIYLPFLYSLSVFSWVGFGDFDKYFRKKIVNTPTQNMDRKEHILFWVSKLLYLLFYVCIPIYFVGWLPWLVGYTVMGLVMGLILSFVFQLAHAVEGPEFDAVGIDDKLIQTEWAIHQIKTTANFAPGNTVISWLVGGLNYQIEHHLFPRISHIHYPALSKIVREKCRQFNLPYHSFPKMGHAIVSHLRIMKLLGQKETVAA